MFGKKSKKLIKFDVSGKLPKKSNWGKDDAEMIVRFRESALAARNKAGLSEGYEGPVKLTLIIYAPNITDMNYKQTGDDDPKKFIGDLDSLVAGVCEYLHKGPKKGENNFEPSPLFDNKPEIGPEVPLIIDDDSQIVEIDAKKELDETTHYHVEVIAL